jgi:hypothetical protein
LRVRLPASIVRFSSATVRGTHHGGLTSRRSWLRIRQSPNITRLSPASVRIPQPRRANARRSWERAFVHRECRFSLRTNVVQQGAAGVSQPWYADPVAIALHRHGGLTPAALANVRLCIAKGVIWPVTGHRAWRQERGASAPRGKHPPLRIGKAYRRRCVAHATSSGGCKPPVESRPHASAKGGKSSHRSHRRGSENHGGLMPAALGCVFASPRTLLDSRRPAFAFPNHGGLTPAALVNARLCIAKGVIWPVTGHRAWRQERGASAPRGKRLPLRIGNAYRSRCVAHANESGGR